MILLIDLKKFKTIEHQSIESCHSFYDVAMLLGVTPKSLRNIVVINKKINYISFDIPKKNGGFRSIDSPRKSLMFLQKKLAIILNNEYNPHPNAHGFVDGKSIVSNANQHLRSKYLLNIDLKDFFPSINFGRVFGLFKSYFRLNENVAATFANICCHHEGYLPQGAPTSPIISNMITYTLDRQLTRFTRKLRCKYTRYVDDITISTNESTFPKEIAYYQDSSLQLSNEINTTIINAGFKVNTNKVYLRTSNQHQSVTGIKVNEKLNVNRSYIRYIRSLLHSLEQYKLKGKLQIAEQKFIEKYNFRHKKNSNKPNIYEVLRGMISFVGQVRGIDDHIYTQFCNRYNRVVSNLNRPMIRKVLNSKAVIEPNVFVIESLPYKHKIEYFPDGEVDTGQGSSFLLKGIGLITNYHVLSKYIIALEKSSEIEPITIHRSNYDKTEYKANVIKHCPKLDIAILDIEGFDYKKKGLNHSLKIENKQNLRVFGFPSYQMGNDISENTGRITGKRFSSVDGLERFEISASIPGGNSGGPVVNEFNEVIGIATKGRDEVPNEIIPIKSVVDFNS